MRLQFFRDLGWSVRYITSDQTQNDRLKTLSNLRENKCKVVVATDLSARGIDAENVGVVIEFDVAWEADTYVHR